MNPKPLLLANWTQVAETGLLALFFFSWSQAVGLKADEPPRLGRHGELIVRIGEDKPINEMAAYPPGGLASRPLLIAAHGNGGSGPEEIESWLALAREHRFTIVCPTFLSAVQLLHVSDDVPYFQDCLNWIESHLQYDRRNAFMTGFSGGGFAVWYVATLRPDFFRGFFLESGNFDGSALEPRLVGWKDKPIVLSWGTNDLPAVIDQNNQAVALLQSEHFTHFSVKLISEGRHEAHRDAVVAWMEKTTGK